MMPAMVRPLLMLAAIGLTAALLGGRAQASEFAETAPPPAPAPAIDANALDKLIEQKIEEREKAKKAEEEKKPQAEKAEGIPIGQDFNLKAVWNNGPQWETADKAFRFHVGGRLDWDNSWYTQSQNLPFALNDGTALRRARLRADGTLWKYIDFACEVNFANIQDINTFVDSVPVGSVGLRDFWVQYNQIPVLGLIRLGHFPAPFGLEQSTSANTWYYMERSPGFDAFINPIEYVSGILAQNAFLDERVTAAATFCRANQQTISPFGFDVGDGEYAVIGRVTALPVWLTDGRVLVHVGASGFHGSPNENSVRVGARPLVRAGGGNQIPNVLRIDTFFTPDGVTEANLEAALVLGPFSLSSEYTMAHIPSVFENFNGVSFSGPRGAVTFHSFYVEGGLFLTPGDHRRFDRRQGAWGRTVPRDSAFVSRGEDGRWCCGSGAVQALLRYSYLDLVGGQPPLTASSPPGAGREHDVTAGIAWYLNPQANIQLNYVYTRLNYIDGVDANFHGLGCRVHLNF